MKNQTLLVEDALMAQLLWFLHAYKGNRMTDQQTAFEILRFLSGEQEMK